MNVPLLVLNGTEGYPTTMPTLAVNKKAKHDYTVIDTVEAGISLLGHEVKSVRAGWAQLTGAFVHERGGEFWLVNMNIPVWQQKNVSEDHDPKRSRKLLVSKKEIEEMVSRMRGENLTIVPISLYTKGPFIKVELALVRPKKQHDKRETLKKRQADREMGRHVKFRG